MTHVSQKHWHVREKLAKLFREGLLKHRVLPRNPWGDKKVKEWCQKLGCRASPWVVPNWNPSEKGFVVVKVKCRNSDYFLRVEVPHELADRILILEMLP